MALKPPPPPPLEGLAAILESLPHTDTPSGGWESGFFGVSDGKESPAAQDAEPQEDFTGLGPVLEKSPEDVFKQLDGLVLRQELIARNHLAIDTHWTYFKLGYPWSTLTKDPSRDRYEQTLPYGQAPIRIQAVPNKAWDLINKTTTALLQDFPQAEALPSGSSEEAQNAAEMANRFLRESSGAEGTNDAILFHDRVERSLTSASSYIEVWTSPTGGGYIPLQIQAHPQATEVANPLVGPDGNPTTDYVLRYVTATDPQGLRQFTDDPSQAAPEWQPAIRTSAWQRENLRVFPESQVIDKAEKVIIVGYCTVSEAKLRWPTIAKMAPQDIDALCDWTPVRYLALLPPFQRARWHLTDGNKAKGGSSDERILFYYHIYCKATPDYPKGADVTVSGAGGGALIGRSLLALPIQVKSPSGTGDKTEIRCMEIPVVQMTPRGDPDERDPSGRAYIELFSGAAENNATLAQGFSQALDIILHVEKYSPVTSPVDGDQIQNSRRTGDAIPIMSSTDKVIYGETPPIPQDFFRFYDLADEAINSIASSERAASGADNSKERSGKALQIAVGQNNIGLSGMNAAVNNAYSRFCRIKIEQCMAHFSTTQQLGYVGEDGAYKQADWTGMDFALVGKIAIKTGTGTLMAPDTKVQYLGNLVASQLLGRDEAADAARPSFSERLGLPPDPQEQRVMRQIDAWLNGPPQGWLQHYQAYQQAKALADQQNAIAQAQFQQAHVQDQVDAGNAQAQGIARPQQILQPPQPVQPTDPMTGQPMAPPWTPFAPLPWDDEPQIASMRQRRLVRLGALVEFTRQPVEWQQTVVEAYTVARNAVAAVQPQPPLPKGVTIGVKAGAGDVGQAEQAALHPATQQQNNQAKVSSPPGAPQAPQTPNPQRYQ